ncbi:hypothetical protein HNQ96_001448 [Aminobacter lissarensis]|uniref:Uncharacterized protein n=1 Tax=Aminobacter carboxidus TaxID=376165 RepID=A0A8E1WDH5_9HYPH|nr:hypothetical protein [Aminobacter lissarensis]MBB6465590.1 hypothetical protein [Aminobacter lissarensis]
MPTNSVRAAAEGMPEINRRRLLIGLAAASTTAATVSIASVATATPGETPALLELGNALPAVEAEYVDSLAAMNAAIESGQKIWPAAPKELHLPRDNYWGTDVIERGITGHGIEHRDQFGDWRSQRIWTDETLQECFDRADKYARSRSERVRNKWTATRDEYAALLPVAKRYEAKCERIRIATGYNAAKTRNNAARAELIDLVGSIMGQPERTMDGIIIKAQALSAWSKVDRTYRALNLNALEWSGQFAASVLKVATGGAS